MFAIAVPNPAALLAFSLTQVPVVQQDGFFLLVLAPGNNNPPDIYVYRVGTVATADGINVVQGSQGQWFKTSPVTGTYPQTGTQNIWTAPQIQQVSVIGSTSSFTPNCSTGLAYVVTGSGTLTVNAPVGTPVTGMNLSMVFKGQTSVIFASGAYKWPSGIVPATGIYDRMDAFYDGTNWIASYAANYA